MEKQYLMEQFYFYYKMAVKLTLSLVSARVVDLGRKTVLTAKSSIRLFRDPLIRGKISIYVLES